MLNTLQTQYEEAKAHVAAAEASLKWAREDLKAAEDNLAAYKAGLNVGMQMSMIKNGLIAGGASEEEATSFMREQLKAQTRALCK